MNSVDDDNEEAEVYAATDKMAQLPSDIPGTGDIHTLYERRAQQYLQLSDGGKALANAVKAVEYRNDSFTAHWLAGKSYVSMAMYDPGICALSTGLELCCFEDKRQQILIDLLMHYCSRKNKLSGATGVFRKISGHMWATVAYELTKTRRFNAAYIAYSQLQKVGPHLPDIHFDLQPLCDLDAVTAETWILDLVTCFLRYGSNHNTMTPQAGDTYIHVVVRMSLAAGVLGLLEYVFGNIVRPGELRGLLDCLGNTALHMAAQCQKCSPLVRLDVMTLLVEAGVDETAKNIDGKTAGSYLLRDEQDFFQCHQKYNSICSGMTATKMKQAVNKIYDHVDIARSEDDIEELQESTQDERIKVQEKEITERTLDGTVSPQTYSEKPHNPQTRKRAENESSGIEPGQDVTRNEIMAKSSQESVTQSHQLLKKFPKLSEKRAASAQLQCSSTAEENVQLSFNKDKLFEPISTDDNADKNVRITSCQENDDRDDSSSPVSPENIDNNNPQTGKKPQNDSSGSELGSNVSCNEIMSKSSQESITQQDVLQDEITDEKCLSDSTGAVSAVGMFSSDNDSIYTSDEQEVIDHHAVEVDEQQVSVTSDTPSAGSVEQFDDTSTSDDDGCEKEHRSLAHSEKTHHDHGKEKLSVTHPCSRDNPTETQEKKATESKMLRTKLKSLYKEGKSWLEIKQYTKGFAVFGKLLQSAPALSTNKYISKTINKICTYLDDTGDSDIPADLIQVPDSHLKQILKGLMDRRKWIPFLGVVCKHGSKENFMDLVKKPENKLSYEQKEAQKDEVLQILQEAIDILLQTSNPELRGEACFLKGMITNEVSDINESWGAFNKCNPRCEAGQLECIDWMVRNSDLHNFQNLLQVVKGMDNLFGVLNLLVSSDKAGGDRVYTYYGLRPTSKGFLKMFPYQKPRALNIMKRCLNKAKRKKTECEVSRNVARDEICRFLLDRGHYWYGEVTLALNKLKTEREQCREFILGRNCTKAADGGKCSALHDIMTERALKNLIDVDLLHLEMDWYVQQGCGRLFKIIAMDLAEMVNVFLPDTENDRMARFKSCEVLLHHLMPRERFPFRMTEKGRVQANRLQEYICKVYIRNLGKRKERKHLKEQMVCFLKAKFNYMKTQERKTNTDVFVQMYFLASYLQLKNVDTHNLMMEFETEVRNEHLQKNQPKIRKRLEPLGFLVDDKDMRNISVQCVARRFCEAYYQLTIPADPLEALIKFTKFIVILGDRNKTAILPELSDFLMWTEYFTTIAVCFGAKNNQVTNVFFLPASYLSLVYFIDSSFQINGQQTFELIQRYKKSWGHDLTLSQERAERIISVLCGSEIGLNLIRHLFKPREDHAMDYGLAERLLVLCMTILCNMGKALFANREADLMQQLCLIALPDDCPKRLMKAVRDVQEADGLSDIAAALKELLHDRDQEHVCLCHWSSSDRYGVKSTPLDKLAFLPSNFVDPNTKKNMTNPGQGRMPTEEDEDVMASSLAELDTDMTMEEKLKWESEQKTYEENRRKENAAGIITRFFKKISFRLQCSMLHCLVEEELRKEQTEKRLKKFQQFGIDDRACTICNVIFDKPSETSDDSKQKLQHQQGLSHTKNMTDFKLLKLTYKTQIAARQEEIVEFIRKHNLKSEKGLQNYADMKLDLTRLVNQSDIAQNEFERILAKRDWGNTRLLTQFFQEVNGCFLNVKPYVEGQWRKLHESKDKAAESSKARNSQAGLGED